MLIPPAFKETMACVARFAVTIVLAGGVALGCRTARAPEDVRPRIEMDALVITETSDPLTGLEAYDAPQLLALASARYASGDHGVVVQLVARAESMFPESELLPELYLKAAMAFDALSEAEEALARCRAVCAHPNGSLLCRDATFRSALLLSRLNRWAEVEEAFVWLRQRGGLNALEEIEARVGQGVAHFMQGEPALAEFEFRAALRFYEGQQSEEYLPVEYWIGQARFYLGEIEARAFEAMTLGAPTEQEEGWIERVGAELEEKCQLLLRAQNHFIRAIRVGHVGWATAAGYRIGSMYERLYDDLLEAPVPGSLDEEARQLYLAELRSRVGVLVVKAIKVYELSLETARRMGESNEWVTRTHASLERMKALYVDALSADG